MMPTLAPAPAWNDPVVAQLLERHACPVCGAAPLPDAVCRRCGADLTSPAAIALWDASQAAASALRTREALRASIPRVGAPPAPAGGTPSPAASGPAQHPRPRPTPPRHRDTTLQSVLAVAGAGLFAVAAVVFTFFSPDLSDPALRGGVTLVATVLLMAGARALSARGLRSSAETTAALAVVFAALDVYAVAVHPALPWGPWMPAALATLVLGTTLLSLSRRWSLRAWVGAPAVGLAAVPAMLGAAAGAIGGTLAGWLTSMAAAAALVVVMRRRERSGSIPLRAEIVALTVAQLVAAAAAVITVIAARHESALSLLWTAAEAFAAVGVIAHLSARHAAAALWSFGTGGAFAAAGLAAAQAVVEALGGGAGWYPVAWIVGPLTGLLLATAALPEHGRMPAMWTSAGALVVAGFGALPVAAMAAYGTLGTVASRAAVTSDDVLSATGAAGALWAGAALLALHGAVMRRRGRVAWASVLASWKLVAAAAATTTIPHAEDALTTVTGLGIAAVLAIVLLRAPSLRASVTVPLSIAAHTALVLGAALSWRDTALAAAAAPFAVGVLLILAARRPAGTRWAHLGAAFAYALAGASAALMLTAIGPIGTVSVVTSAAGIGAMLATFSRRVPVRTWWAILAVTSVPFALGILQVVRERSGWTALSTAIIFLLALTLTATRRPGLGTALRALCAAVLVPALAVVVICLGAQVLAMSASPVTLPLIATIVAASLAIPDAGRARLEARGVPRREAQVAAWTFEGAALVTGGVAIALSLSRTAAGLPTAALVLTLLAVGGGAAALLTKAARVWWYAAAAGAGAWVVWLRMWSVEVVELYVVPPALTAVIVGTVLARRGSRGRALVWAGLLSAVSASVVALAAAGGPWRFAGLLIVSALLLVIGSRIRQSSPGRRTVRAAALVSAMLAAAAGPVWGVRAVSVGTVPSLPEGFWVTLGCAAAGAVLALLAGVALGRSRTGEDLAGGPAPGGAAASARWVLAPALLWLCAGTWPVIERDPVAIWGMWALMLALCAAVVAIAWRRRTHDGILPPVWFVFSLAFVTAIVAWSPRDLRVEWFSLPLGAALLIAGAVHLRRDHPGSRVVVDAWPRTARGSWALLTPGLVVLFSASTAATFTDPLTWRAVLVMVMALGAILVGARLRLAAPFVLGIVVLPIENVSAFAVQIGRGIDSMPWWITLAAVGAVLLILAVSYERRAGEPEGFAARMRDLA